MSGFSAVFCLCVCICVRYMVLREKRDRDTDEWESWTVFLFFFYLFNFYFICAMEYQIEPRACKERDVCFFFNYILESINTFGKRFYITLFIFFENIYK